MTDVLATGVLHLQRRKTATERASEMPTEVSTEVSTEMSTEPAAAAAVHNKLQSAHNKTKSAKRSHVSDGGAAESGRYARQTNEYYNQIKYKVHHVSIEGEQFCGKLFFKV
jgi:hypothetical protein